MLVVSDTTALTTLLKSGQVRLLEALFGSLLIPRAVAEELSQFHQQLPAFCEVRTVMDSSRLTRLRESVDRGEAEAICLAVELGADALLIDDKKGRRAAEVEGLTCLGVPVILLAAKQRGLLPALAPVLDMIAQRGNYRLSAEARLALLKAAGE